MIAYVRVWSSEVLHVRHDCAYLARTRDFELMEVEPSQLPPLSILEWRLCSHCSTGGRVGLRRPAPELPARLEWENGSVL